MFESDWKYLLNALQYAWVSMEAMILIRFLLLSLEGKNKKYEFYPAKFFRV